MTFNIEHRNIQPADNHGLVAFIYANEQTRVLSPHEPTDAYKVAYQMDNASLWYWGPDNAWHTLGGGGTSTAVDFGNGKTLGPDGPNRVVFSSPADATSIAFDFRPVFFQAPPMAATLGFAPGPVSGLARGLNIYQDEGASIHTTSSTGGLHIISEFLPQDPGPGTREQDRYPGWYSQGMIDWHTLNHLGDELTEYPHIHSFYNITEAMAELGLGGDTFGLLVKGFSGDDLTRTTRVQMGLFGGLHTPQFRVPPEGAVDQGTVFLETFGGSPARFSVANLVASNSAQVDGGLVVGGSITAASSPVGRQVAVPSSATDPGNPGDFAVGGGYAYFCTAPNTWVRAPVASW